MDNTSMFILAGIVGGGLLMLLFYVLCVSLRDMARQMARTNELLLLAWRAKEGDGFAARALVTRAAGLAKTDRPEPPQGPKKAEGVAEKKSEFKMTMGGR